MVRIISIDGRSAGRYPYQEVQDLLQQEGREFLLTVQRIDERF